MIGNALLLALAVWGAAAIAMGLLFVLAWRAGKTGLVDVAWAYGVGLAGATFALLAEGTLAARRAMIAGLILFWAARLGTMLLRRVLRNPEDGRYAAMIDAWGDRARRSMALFYQAQGLWVMLFALPVLAAALGNSAPLRWTDGLALAIGVVAILGEGLADRQLASFRADPTNRGRVMQSGLWGWSRHPNYFFEWVFWFAYVAFAVPASYGWAALMGPIVMGLFLWRVTGIPYTERQALKSRGEAYRRYQQTTSAFFPWPPRESAS